MKGLLGVAMETVRTFLAVWIAPRERQLNWEPEIPTASVELNTDETPERENLLSFTWACQRELQRKVAEMSTKGEKMPENAALIMLFLLGFPILNVKYLGFEEVAAQHRPGEGQEGRATSSSDRHRAIDLVPVWRLWTPLAPQDISLNIQCDSDRGTVFFRLQNDGDNTKFKWQDWVDAAMGCMRGFEEGHSGELGYGRKIVQANLRKPLVKVGSLENKDVIAAIDERASKALVWTGWPAFDVRICKFELKQLLDVCEVNLGYLGTDEVMKDVEKAIEPVVSAENDEIDVPTSADQEIANTDGGE